MFCPACQCQNLPTSLRCSQCGASLLPDSPTAAGDVGKTARAMDARNFSIWGGLAGAVLVFVLLNLAKDNLHLDDGDLKLGALIGAVAGAALGRVVAWKKWQD